MYLAGIHSDEEGVNFLMGKVPEPWMMSYINHVTSYDQSRKRKDDIVPDLHIYNMPSGRQLVNDSGPSQRTESLEKSRHSTPIIQGTINTTTAPTCQQIDGQGKSSKHINKCSDALIRSL